LPAAFAKAVDRALSVDPADRFQSAETMRAALESALGKSHRRLSVRALRAGAVTIGIAALASAVALTWMRNADPVRVAATSTQKVRERKLRVPQYPMGVPSRDGRFFPYVSSAGHLYVWEVATGQSRRLNAADAASGSARSASMSAAADRVAVGWRLSDGAHELRVLNADGTSLRALVGRQQAYEPVPLDWSRDDQWILCWFRQKNGTSDLVLVSPETGDIRLRHSFSADQAPDAQLSPDGRFVILSSVEPEIENAGLHLLPTEMPSTPALLEGTANAAFGRWTPDGTSVLFLRWNGTTLDGWLTPIANGEVQGPPAMVRPKIGAPIALAVTDNGALYRILQTTTSDVYVASFDPSGSSPPGAPVRVWQGSVGNRVGPAWSPDGRSIAYFTTQPADSPGITPKRTLTIQDWVSPSGEPRQIHVPIRFLGGWSPRWSPDGRYVMVWGRDGESLKDFGYFRVDIATGDATKIVTLGTNTMAVSQYSPDGAQFFYLSPSRGIVGRNLATGSESVIIAADAQSAPARFAVSPDGRSIAFIRIFVDRASALDVQAFGGRRVRLARARHPDRLDLQAWTPDGQYLLYRGVPEHRRTRYGGYQLVAASRWTCGFRPARR
jgi:Tol biopolymer transport system component